MAQYKIDWTTAAVSNGTLTVSLSPPPGGQPAPTPQTRWGSFFNQIASQPIPGVPYSMSRGWGSVSISEGRITVREVSDQVVELVKTHLDAAVERATEEYERYLQEQ